MSHRVKSFGTVRCAAWIVLMVVFVITTIFRNNLYNSIVPARVANGNSIVALILGGLVSQRCVGIGPIDALLWPSDRIAKAIEGKWWIAALWPAKAEGNSR